ncbi:MAG: ATPase, T2SS/T4P/T4SS family [Anaerolineaceae bacterium]|nr:ATPase, T2SS/T4P/T4SS family [Anaerolineaceae bacterium]
MMDRDNGRGLLDLYETNASTLRGLDAVLREQLAGEVIDQVNREFPQGGLQDRGRVVDRIQVLLSLALRRGNVSASEKEAQDLAGEIGRRLFGLGFLDLLLPPVRTDLSEICIYSSGLVQVMKKNQVRWETVPDLDPTPAEISRVLDRLLGPQNKALNEANPTVHARLSATPANPGGGRIKALHPVIAPPGRNPAINIRLFEQKPVHPEWILEREMMSTEMMETLRTAIEQGYRLLITGGTRTGKTTLLSALCNYLPDPWRIVKIEDPMEIWIDRPTVQTIEARPAALGTELEPYTLADGVDDAMRMSPDYLIVGEVRDGHSALSLFRAMLTGHAGACTFHADSPREAVRRLATVLGADTQVRVIDAHQLIAEAIDMLVQIGIRDETRRVTVIANVRKNLVRGEVSFDPVFRYHDQPGTKVFSWEKVGELSPRLSAEGDI